MAAARPEAARLRGLRVTNAVKCLPPGNRPLPAELRACRSYLTAELEAFWRPGVRRNRVLLALGGLAWRATQDAARELLPTAPERRQPFAHGVVERLAGTLWLVGSYHPSRLNTQTGRLTVAGFDRVLATTVELLAAA